MHSKQSSHSLRNSCSAIAFGHGLFQFPAEIVVHLFTFFENAMPLSTSSQERPIGGMHNCFVSMNVGLVKLRGKLYRAEGGATMANHLVWETNEMTTMTISTYSKDHCIELLETESHWSDMVSTRRQKERAASQDLSEPVQKEAVDPVVETTPVDDVEETNDDTNEKEVTPEAADENDSPSDTDEPEVKADVAVESPSELFVLDRTGEESDGDGDKDEEKNLELGSGLPKKQRRERGRKGKAKQPGNPLSKLLPGYTAPMQLDTSSLEKYRPGGMKALQRLAERTDVSTRGFVKEATKAHADVMKSKSTGMVKSSYTAAYSSFKKGAKRAPEQTAGDGWFGMRPAPMTEELKNDLAVIRNRNYLDPKKFYKSADKQGNIVQLGTVIEGAAEYYSGRLTKKQRRSNFTEEIMADPDSAKYAKKKFRSMAQEKTREALQRKRIHRPKRGKRFHS